MKKKKLNTLLASVLAITVSNTANAFSVDITEFVLTSPDDPDFRDAYAAEGTLIGSADGDLGRIDSLDDFFYSPWVAHGDSFFDFGTTGTTWAGTTTINANVTPFSYDIDLTETQVAWGLRWT